MGVISNITQSVDKNSMVPYCENTPEINRMEAKTYLPKLVANSQMMFFFISCFFHRKDANTLRGLD